MSQSSGINFLLFEKQEDFFRLQCSYCEQLLENPVQPICGHRFCKPCAENIINNHSPPQCPKEDCRKEWTENGYHVSILGILECHYNVIVRTQIQNLPYNYNQTIETMSRKTYMAKEIVNEQK